MEENVEKLKVLISYYEFIKKGIMLNEDSEYITQCNIWNLDNIIDNLKVCIRRIQDYHKKYGDKEC
jgi:hypothetical protein